MKPTRKANALEWLRRRARALGGVEEKVAWGHPTFRAGGRIIAAFEIVKGRPSIAVLADRDEQEVLLRTPDFFKTPYAGRWGWVSAWVDGPARWDILESLLAEAHQCAVKPRPGTPRANRKPVRQRIHRAKP